MNVEESKQLDLLSIFHYVVGGIMALFACMPFLHVFMGLAVVSGKRFKNFNETGSLSDAFGHFAWWLPELNACLRRLEPCWAFSRSSF